MSTEQFTALLEVLGHHTFALAVTAAAEALTAFAALCALILAWRHILTARAETKANVIRELDARWEGAEMKPARAKWHEIRSHVMELVETKYCALTTEEKEIKISQECATYLHDYRTHEPREYNASILSIIGFFETAGYNIHHNYVSAEDVISLFGEAIREFDRLCWRHMQKRIEESKSQGDGITTLFAHSCSLISQTRKWYVSYKLLGS